MRWLITGVSGYAGEALARWARDQDDEVVGTFWTREPALAAGARAVRAELGDARALGAAMAEAEPTAIVHAAAMADAAQCEADPVAARRAIVEGTERLIEARERGAPGAALLYLSTDLVFDGEEAPYGAEAEPTARSVYGRCKAEAERRALAAGGSVARVSLLYGPRSRYKPGALFWMVDGLARGPITLFEDEVRTPLHIDDLAAGLGALARRPGGGVWHLGGPDALSRVEMGLVVCRVLGLDASLVRAVKRADVPSPAPRPRDVSLRSGPHWSALGVEPRGFERGARDALAAG